MKKLLAILMALIIILMTASVALGDGESSKKVEPRRRMCIQCNMGDIVVVNQPIWSLWENLGDNYYKECPHNYNLKDFKQVRTRVVTEGCTYCDYRRTYIEYQYRYLCTHV